MSTGCGVDIRVRAKRFPARGNTPERDVLRDIRLSAPPGGFTCLTGPSGCGKTTLLNIVAGLDTEFDGDVSFPDASGGRPRIGYMFQNPRLLPWRTVRENIAIAVDAAGAPEENVEKLIGDVGLTAFADAHPETLSVGMARRVALARAFAIEPEVLLMDEPFVSLDAASAGSARALLKRIRVARPVTTLFVTHDLSEAIELGDRIVVLPEAAAPISDQIEVTLTPGERGERRAIEAFRERHFPTGARQ